MVFLAINIRGIFVLNTNKYNLSSQPPINGWNKFSVFLKVETASIAVSVVTSLLLGTNSKELFHMSEAADKEEKKNLFDFFFWAF